MSLADLPNELIADLTDYLDYTDVCNLMETSKKNYNAIKLYKKDKIALHALSFYQFGRRPLIAIDSSSKNFLFKDWKEYDLRAFDNIKRIVEKCKSIDLLLFSFEYSLTSELCGVLCDLNPKTKIRELSISTNRVKPTREEVLKLCGKFRVSFVLGTNDEVVLHDEVLTNILPVSTVRIEYISLADGPMNITDLTLNALIGKHEVQRNFSIHYVRNYITVKAVVKAITILQERNVEGLNWNLGIFQRNQREDAERYFGEHGYGVIKETCDIIIAIHIFGQISFEIVDRTGKFTIRFIIDHR